MSALARYHVGGGARHCAGCAADPMFACARFGGQGICPEDEHAPETEEGALIWATAPDFLNQVRLAQNGTVLGLDFPTCAAMARGSGASEAIFSLFFPYLEAGVIAAAAELREQAEGADAP